MTLYGVTRTNPRLERMVPVRKELDASSGGEPVGRDFIPATQPIPVALDDQRRSTQPFQVCRSQTLGLVRWVKRVPQTDESPDSGLVGNHTGDPASHGLASDGQPPVLAEPVDHLQPGCQ